MVKKFLETEKWSEKKKNFLDGIDDDSMWCLVCSTIFFKEDMFQNRMTVYGVSKLFRHNFENENVQLGA